MDDITPEFIAVADRAALITALAAARKENERLREALKAIASCESHVPGDVVRVARSALAREDGEK